MKLVYWPDPILKKISVELAMAPEPGLIDSLKDTMRKYRGSGLSAIQVGIPIRAFVTEDLGEHTVFLNPEIVDASKTKSLMVEGCLSVPGFFEQVLRHDEVLVSFRDQDFDPFVLPFSGRHAHVIQHELEHLDGKLYLDHLTSAQRSRIKGEMMKLKKSGKLR